MPDLDNHLRQLNGELDELRHSLVKLRAQLTLPSANTARAEAMDVVHKHLNALRTSSRLLQTDAAELRQRLEQAEREAWDQKVRRADATAKLKSRNRLLDQIQGSAAWKIVKPFWKLFHRSQRHPIVSDVSSDMAFALDLPKSWKTKREVLLIKGWCFSRSGRSIAGVRAKMGRKARIARYGLERLDVAASFREYPAALHCGFTVELKVPPGVSTVQLEAIEQGSEWRPFFDVELKRTTDPSVEEQDEVPVRKRRASCDGQRNGQCRRE